jgi:hypothetical protein
MSFNFSNKDFQMGCIYGRLEQMSNNNNNLTFEDFVDEVNEQLKVQNWEMLEDLVGLYSSSDTEYVVANGKKFLKITDLEEYCRLENGSIIVENVDETDEKELLEYPELYQIRYITEKGGDEEFYRKNDKWEWDTYEEVLEEFNHITKKFKLYDIWITKTPAEADEDEFMEQYGMEYPEPERLNVF